MRQNGKAAAVAAGLVAETERLILREFTTGDAPLVLRLLNEPSFVENIGDRGVRTAEEAVRYLNNGPIASYARHGHGLYLVALKQGLQPIGMCGLLKRDNVRDVDLGYAFLPEFWSNGYARESAAAVLGIARKLHLTAVAAFVSPGNAPSIRLLDKLGFAPAGKTKLEPKAAPVSVYRLQLRSPPGKPHGRAQGG
jgi:[ribosomal protein S5]-alanine N-acetyltransferase